MEEQFDKNLMPSDIGLQNSPMIKRPGPRGSAMQKAHKTMKKPMQNLKKKYPGRRSRFAPKPTAVLPNQGSTIAMAPKVGKQPMY